MKARHLVVDGSNIATEGRSRPSLEQLDEAVRAYLAEQPHEKLTVVVDATFEHRIDRSEKKTYDEALAAGELITPPAGTVGRGDKFLLEVADKAGATVLSNDSFQEFHGEYPWLFDEGRLVGGKPVPEVGWVFTVRTPVRGPRSRQAVREATRQSRKRSGQTDRPAAAKAEKAVSKASRRGRRREAPAEPKAETKGRGGRRPRGKGPAHPEPVNEPLPFLEFIAEHPVGSTVTGTVDAFASHGAYIRVGEARCYVPLKAMGDPPPRSAREILTKGEDREFVVQALDAPRRGIDLALPGFEEIEAAVSPAAETAQAEKALAEAGAEPTEREVQRLAAAKRAPAKKKAPAKKSPAKKKAPAKKSPAKKKAPAKKSPAKKKAPAKKSPAKKKAGAKKSPAKKKAGAKKSPAKKKAGAKKAPARKAAKKSTKKSTKRAR